MITYDEIGNPLTIGDKTLNWKNDRQLKRIWNSDNTLNVKYEYNKDGIRTSKQVNGVNRTEYYLEGSNIVVAKTGNNVLYFICKYIESSKYM